MTRISLVATDQLLSVALQPKVASGDQNSVELHVDFDSEWDGYGRSAVFYTSDNDTVFESPLTDGNCVIPHEVLANPGILYIGVRGVNSSNNAVKTSSLVKYKIAEGAPAGDGTTVEPTADVYQQILTAYGKTDAAIAQEAADRQAEIAVERARINQFTALAEGSTTGDAELTDIRVGANGIRYGTAGEAVRGQFDRVQKELAKNELISKNLFDISAYLPGSIVWFGSFTTNDSFGRSDYIPVKPNTSYTMSLGYSQCVNFFDTTKKYISCLSADEKPYTFTTPATAAYAIVNMPKERIGATPENFMFVEGEEIPDAYVPYGMDYTPIYRILEKEGFTKWLGKTIVTFGDSITWYDGNTFGESHSEIGQTAIGYQSYMRESLGCEVVNQGRSGYTMPKLLPYVKAYNYANVDAVTLTIGANDFRMSSESLGSISTIGGEFDETTFYGSIQSAVEHILNAKPTVKLFLITPIKGWSGWNGAEEMPVAYPNAIKEIAALYSLPVCDWYSESGINALTRGVYIGDDGVATGYYLHPTNAGFKRMGDKLVSFLQNN